jgi:hypothetical protein
MQHHPDGCFKVRFCARAARHDDCGVCARLCRPNRGYEPPEPNPCVLLLLLLLRLDAVVNTVAAGDVKAVHGRGLVDVVIGCCLILIILRLVWAH